ncbi:MAG: N-acetylglucosamine-6-phosphate deacetylase [Sedimentisphaerales bacterium]|nr:N-acetylglucosamine-6-phosphate deacetylase [Sedimentisphaerales bacterium]
MSSTLIHNAAIVLPDQVLSRHSLFIDAGKIAQILPAQDAYKINADQTIDAANYTLAPGFIDLHIHGIHNYRPDAGLEDYIPMAATLPQYGVTGFLPTLFPNINDNIEAQLKRLAQAAAKGAQVLGFHLEGPFVKHSGAAAPDTIGTANPQRIRDIIEAAQPYRVIFSISPDLPGINELIPVMAQNNTPVFITHTSADVAQTQASIAAGACHATHFYDVFYAPPESEPGVRPCGSVEAILADPNVSVDFILDGVHVDPIAVKMALQCKPNNTCLVTDANVGAGLPPGRYKYTSVEIEFTEIGLPARLTENSHAPGALAGSGLTMDRAFRNAISMLNVDLPTAARITSATPAKVLRIDHQKGKIQTGFDADLVLLDPKLNVRQTFVAGQTVFSEPKA